MTDNNDTDGDHTDLEILVFGDEDDTAEDNEPVAVGIADYAVTDQGQPLSTSGLGSCLAVVVHDADAGVNGLLHCMLPVAAESPGEHDAEAKFADTGIETMLESFRAAGGDPSRSWAKMAGGASMIEFSSSAPSIGERNADAARATLEAHGVSLEGADVGGQSGRAVVFDPVTGELTVTSPTGDGKDL